MGILSTIFDKLGLGKKKETAAPPAPAKAVPAPASKPVASPPASIPTVASPKMAPTRPAATEPSPPPKPAPMDMVDVVSKLDKMAAGTGLKWRVSIADLLAVLKIDNSLKNRKELAAELGCPPEYIKPDYAKMNMWLHKKVLQEIAENGGNIPKELTD